MITEITDNTKREPSGWVLYDGRCGFCSASARRAAPMLAVLDLALLPLQTPWVVRRLGVDPMIPPSEMALLTRDGLLITGVDAYLHVAEQLWWARPLARLGRFCPIHHLLRVAYAWIAARRQRISAVCRLQPDLPPATEVPDDRRLLH